MKRFLTLLLASFMASPGLLPLSAQAQYAPPASGAEEKRSRATAGFIIYVNERGETECRPATDEERRRIANRSGDARTIYGGAPRRRTTAGGEEKNTAAAVTPGSTPKLLPSAGLTIVLHGTDQLEQHPAAKEAFIVAANRWEAIISSPITVVLDVDYGPQFFGQDYPDPDILGQTGTSRVSTNLSNVRTRLINSNPTANDATLYNALPTGSLPVEYNGTNTTVSNVRMARPNARALGLVGPPNVDAEIGFGDAGIGFNSAFNFDFTPDDGIEFGKTDFDSVVTHEIGHALGFISSAGDENVAPTRVEMWDLFRFRPGAGTVGTFGTAQRVMSAGGTQVFFNNLTNTFGTTELGLSTGGPSGDATGGDGRQSSHWKADELSGGVYIGIMDPTISSGRRRTLTQNDLNAIDSLGYSVGGTAPPPPPPPPPPSNDAFANAVTLVGATGTTSTNNLTATRESGEPLIAGNGGGKSVWFTWTSPGTGTATFDTTGSDFDTLLGIYAGGSVGLLSLVGHNDDIILGDVTESRVVFQATAGTTYRIAVDGYDGDAGNIVLNWSGPSGPPPSPGTLQFSSDSYFVFEGALLANVTVHRTGGSAGAVSVNYATSNGTALAGSDYTAVSGTLSFADGELQKTFTVPLLDDSTFESNETVNLTLSSPTNGATLGLQSASTIFIGNDDAQPQNATIMGRVTEGTNGLSGVLVGLFQGTTLLQQTTTGADGRWTFNNTTVGQAYNVVFVKSGYTFSPPSLIFPVNEMSQDMGDVPATAGNPIGRTDFFVTKHYEDFLGRQPDASGLAFWSNGIESCGFNMQCREVKRIDTSAAFFFAIEFQQTGYLVERMYKAAYGDAVGTTTWLNGQSVAPTQIPVPAVRRSEFLADSGILQNGLIVGQPGWEGVLENNKQLFASQFVARARFTTAYPTTMTPAAFVAKINENVGGALSPADVDALVAQFAGASNTADASKRAAVVRLVAENAEVERRERSKAFVLMQFFGYLHRDPDASPDTNHTGWRFWLEKLEQFNGNYIQAQMVKAFLDSTEYRQRFGQP